MTPNSSLALMQRRRQFVGTTDKYLVSRQGAPTPSTGKESKAEDPFSFLDVADPSGAFNELYKETAQERMNRYRLLARFYQGKQWDNPYDDSGEKKPIRNFCSTIVNKHTDFFSLVPWNAVSRNEDIASIVDAVWTHNNKASMFRALASVSSMLGETFLYLSVDTKGTQDKKQWAIRMVPIEPFFAFPVFDPTEPGKLAACLLKFPDMQTLGAVSFDSLYFSKSVIRYIKGDTIAMETENVLGLVPVVHIPNYTDGVTPWGISDIEEIVPLNTEYNTTALSMRRIIKYHAEPTTVIFGARASRLEKGANKLWSGLPSDAKVENLSFDSDLPGIQARLADIKEAIYETSGIPGAAFNTDRAVSHASGVAIKMLYQPLIERKMRKEIHFTRSFHFITEIIFSMFDQMSYSYRDVMEAEDTYKDISPLYGDPLPYDEGAKVDIDLKKLAGRLVSHESLVRKYNSSLDFAETVEAIVADILSAQLMKREDAVGAKGEKPSIMPVLVSSLGLATEAEEFLSRVEGTIPDHTVEDTTEPTSTETQQKDTTDAKEETGA